MRNHVFSLWALRPTPSTPPSLQSSHVSTGKYGAWLAVTLAVSFLLSDISHALRGKAAEIRIKLNQAKHRMASEIKINCVGFRG